MTIKMNKDHTARLIALFFLGFVVFNFPIIDLSGSTAGESTFPTLFFTVFLFWAIFIFLTWILADGSFFTKKKKKP
jgi:uncharacterized membrane protein